jgi:hypothetical protein
MRGLSVVFVLRLGQFLREREYGMTNVERKRLIKVDRRGIRRFDLEAAWDEDDGKTHPEATVRRQSSATKDVS